MRLDFVAPQMLIYDLPEQLSVRTIQLGVGHWITVVDVFRLAGFLINKEFHVTVNKIRLIRSTDECPAPDGRLWLAEICWNPKVDGCQIIIEGDK